MFQWFQKLTKQKTILIIFVAIALLVGVFMAAQPAAAALLDPLVPACRAEKGGCNVCDAIGVGINITKIMLGTLGSAALLVFVYGGVLMAISRGHSDQVQKGKDALTNAVKGVIIVLGSWVVINYGLAMMLNQDVSKPATIFGGQWATVACSGSGNSTISCENKAPGTDCGDNMVCDGIATCISECQYEHSENGYSCRPFNTCQGYANGKTYENDCGSTVACFKGLCSGNLAGVNTQVCCLP